MREEGIEAEIIRISGTGAVAALVSGEADYFTGMSFSVRAAIQGLPLKVVACYIQGNQQTLVARGDLKSARNSKGKLVAVNNDGKISHDKMIGPRARFLNELTGS